MKKFAFFVLCMILLTSCQRDRGIDISLMEKAENITQTYPTETDSRMEDEYYGEWEDELQYDVPDITEYNGISIIGGTDCIYNGKLYFNVKKKYQDQNHTTGALTHMYIDLETGENHYVCPDPLCSHVFEDNCGSYNPYIMVKKDGKGYDFIYRMDDKLYYDLYEWDLVTGETNCIYTIESDYRNGETKMGNVIDIDADLLWFTVTEWRTDTETKIEVKSTCVYSMDLMTGDICESIEFPDAYDLSETWISWVADDRFYMTSDTCMLFSADMDFRNEQILIDEPITADGRDQLIGTVFDDNTGEVFVLNGNTKQRTGAIYRIKNGEIEKLAMPHDEIYHFQLTKDKIYYMTFDPYVYFVDDEGRETADYGGGKIYVTDRNTHDTAELFFDSEMQIPLRSNWCVIGNYVYVSTMDYNPGGEHPFSSAFNLKKARINVNNNTIRYFRFD